MQSVLEISLPVKFFVIEIIKFYKMLDNVLIQKFINISGLRNDALSTASTKY